MTASTELAWLLEQIAQDERKARAVGEHRRRWHFGEFSDSVTVMDSNDYVACGPWSSSMDADDAAHIVNFDPMRVLAECGAKRQLARIHDPLPPLATRAGWKAGTVACRCCGYGGEYPVAWPCDTIRLVAAPYADRPGYPEEWRWPTI